MRPLLRGQPEDPALEPKGTLPIHSLILPDQHPHLPLLMRAWDMIIELVQRPFVRHHPLIAGLTDRLARAGWPESAHPPPAEGRRA